jgi:hypothetical protein
MRPVIPLRFLIRLTAIEWFAIPRGSPAHCPSSVALPPMGPR